MQPIIETGRLRLRPFTVADTGFILQLLNSEGWLTYIGDRNVRTTARATDYLVNGPLQSYRVNGFGLYLVELKPGGEPAGMCGLIRRDYLPGPDIGFAFLPEYTGQGYAVEITGKLVAYAFDQLRLDRILAITLPGNDPSIRLLGKLGFSQEGQVVHGNTGQELLLYGLNKPALQAGVSPGKGL